MNKRIIFVSAVSNEFHNAPEGQRHLFTSYRDVLARAFRVLAPHYEVIVQEDLPQGFGDLLETLDHEIARSLIVIHLVGNLAGFAAPLAAAGKLQLQHRDLLASEPALKTLLAGAEGITYTQWELYLALHHQCRVLIFVAAPETVRSPLAGPVHEPEPSQRAHRARIETTGRHYGAFLDQGDVTRKAMRAFLHFRIDPSVDPVEPSAEALAEAWKGSAAIVNYLAEAIRKPDPRAVPVADPANAAAFVAAVRAAAARWQVNHAAIVDIAARYEQEMRAVAQERPSPVSLQDQAFAELALGDYTAAVASVRRAADMALELMASQPADVERHREDALNAFLLLHECAKAARNTEGAIAALESASQLLDRQAAPLQWADMQEMIAGFLLDQEYYDRARGIIDDLIDLREDLHGESSPALGRTLLLWARLRFDLDDFEGALGIARRAEAIFSQQIPPVLHEISDSLHRQGWSLIRLGRYVEAERVLQVGVGLLIQMLGDADIRVSSFFMALGVVLGNTGRAQEGESMLRRALDIDTRFYGEAHPAVGSALLHLAHLLDMSRRVEDAEELYRRALAIETQAFGEDHPRLAPILSALGALLRDNHRMSEAEPFLRRVLEMKIRLHRGDHQDIVDAQDQLARCLEMMGALEDADRLYAAAEGRRPDKMELLGDHAFFLQNYRQDYPAAREIYLKALQVAPHDAVNLANFAGLCVVMDRHDEARARLDDAWRVSRVHADRYTCRILLLRTALAMLHGEAHGIYLGQLKAILTKGIQPFPSRNTSVWEYLQKHVKPEDYKLIEAVFTAINEPHGLALLEATEAWRAVSPVALDVEWTAS